jgi:hypothetical protein
VAADPHQVMRVLRYRAVDVQLANGELRARYRHGQMPPDMGRFIRYFRELIIDELRTMHREAA